MPGTVFTAAVASRRPAHRTKPIASVAATTRVGLDRLVTLRTPSSAVRDHGLDRLDRLRDDQVNAELAERRARPAWVAVVPLARLHLFGRRVEPAFRHIG